MDCVEFEKFRIELARRYGNLLDKIFHEVREAKIAISGEYDDELISMAISRLDNIIEAIEKEKGD